MRVYRGWQAFLTAIDRRLERLRGYPTTKEEQEELWDGFYDEAHTWDSEYVRRALLFLEAPREEKRALALPGVLVPHLLTMELQDDASTVRQLLGLNEIVPFDRLEQTLANLSEDGDLALEYPIAKGYSEIFPIWEIKRIQISSKNQRLVLLKRYVDTMAQVYSCHAALVLAFFLCEIPLYRNPVAVFLERNMIMLQVRSPSVSPDVVSKAYILARSRIGYEPKRIRRTSERVQMLVAFIDSYPELTWEERFIKWNQKYRNKKWQYEDVSSMQVVYSRVAKKRKGVISLVESMAKAHDRFEDYYDSEYFRQQILERLKLEEAEVEVDIGYDPRRITTQQTKEEVTEDEAD